MWEECIKFHGHVCPGLAIGYAASIGVKDLLDLEFSLDEEVVCITENDACGVDAIQVVLGCTFGKGNLIFKDLGKSAYNFYNRSTDKSVRLVLKEIPENLTREEKIDYLLHKNVEDLFLIEDTKYRIPSKAKIYNSINCTSCKEFTSEKNIRVYRDMLLCLDCYDSKKK